MADRKTTDKKIEIDMMQSALRRARGLGSAKSGLHHWWAQRVTAIALVPLSLWFIWNVIALGGASHEAVLFWAGGPVTIVLLLALVLATFYHMQLGLQVVIEDYVHAEGAKLVSLLAMKGVAALLALACLVSILKIGL